MAFRLNIEREKQRLKLDAIKRQAVKDRKNEKNELERAANRHLRGGLRGGVHGWDDVAEFNRMRSNSLQFDEGMGAPMGRLRSNSAPPTSNLRTAELAEGEPSGPGLIFEGCKHKKFGGKINGTYSLSGENHGRPIYEKNTVSKAKAVKMFYWDGRDGDEQQGWWIAPNIGSSTVYAFLPDPNGSSEQPPTTGWKLPRDGDASQWSDWEVDTNIKVTLRGVVASSASVEAAGAQGDRSSTNSITLKVPPNGTTGSGSPRAGTVARRTMVELLLDDDFDFNDEIQVVRQNTQSQSEYGTPTMGRLRSNSACPVLIQAMKEDDGPQDSNKSPSVKKAKQKSNVKKTSFDTAANVTENFEVESPETHVENPAESAECAPPVLLRASSAPAPASPSAKKRATVKKVVKKQNPDPHVGTPTSPVSPSAKKKAAVKKVVKKTTPVKKASTDDARNTDEGSDVEDDSHLVRDPANVDDDAPAELPRATSAPMSSQDDRPKKKAAAKKATKKNTDKNAPREDGSTDEGSDIADDEQGAKQKRATHLGDPSKSGRGTPMGRLRSNSAPPPLRLSVEQEDAHAGSKKKAAAKRVKKKGATQKGAEDATSHEF